MEKTDRHMPDILNCLANLSSDEVFTSPELANRMLDLLPQELFSNPGTTFLDPCSKSGVFLREIVRRLLKGLETAIPDLQQRIDHIMRRQVFGIALTQLTADMSRRTLYCAKKADGRYSVSTCFANEQGNLRYQRCEHTWVNGKCALCGANRAQYDRIGTIENYAYPFIHQNINQIFPDMQFDVIIGNPPYQLNDGGGTGSSAGALYNKFVEQSRKLSPKNLIMIIPSRWMTGGKGLDDFRKSMISDRHIRILHDYLNSTDCFTGVNIEGGICYYLWNREETGPCDYYLHNSDNEIIKTTKYLDEGGKSDIVIRNPNIISILEKVRSYHEDTFDKLVSTRNPFKILDNVEDITVLTRTQRRLLCRKDNNRQFLYLSDDFTVNRGTSLLSTYKLFMSKADGAAGQIGNPVPARIIGNPECGYPNDICTETFLCIGPLESEKLMHNVKTYLCTKFFRCLVGIRKNKNMTHDTYKFVPLQDFSHPWTDQMLYEKYGLDEKEVAFIESMIKPME